MRCLLDWLLLVSFGAIILQKEELELQRKELKETRTELQKQSFESSFFQLLGFYKEIVNSVKGQTSQHSGTGVFCSSAIITAKKIP